jgi:hypothetical protein
VTVPRTSRSIRGTPSGGGGHGRVSALFPQANSPNVCLAAFLPGCLAPAGGLKSYSPALPRSASLSLTQSVHYTPVSHPIFPPTPRFRLINDNWQTAPSIFRLHIQHRTLRSLATLYSVYPLFIRLPYLPYIHLSVEPPLFKATISRQH